MEDFTAGLSRLIGLLLLGLCFSAQSFAVGADYFMIGNNSNRKSNFCLLAQTFTYNDISVSQDDDEFVHKPSAGVSLGLRVHQIFMISLLYRQNVPDQRKTSGFSFKAYVPGFLMIGDNITNFISTFSRRRIHTYFEGEVGLTSMVDEDGSEGKFIDTVGRFGMEITLVSGMYLDLSYGVNASRGNNTIAGGVGLGARF